MGAFRRKAGRKRLSDSAKGGTLIAVSTDLFKSKLRSNPKILQDLCAAVRKTPHVVAICTQVGIAETTLRYWLHSSRTGSPGDGWDMAVEHGTKRFHEAFAEAWGDGGYNVWKIVYDAATGKQKKILTFQGHVQYKIDPVIAKDAAEMEDFDWNLHYPGRRRSDIYMKDADGQWIQETVEEADLETARWFLSKHDPEAFGNRMEVKHEHEVKGGVLVVGAPMTPKQVEQTFGGESKIEDVEFEVLPSATEEDK